MQNINYAMSPDMFTIDLSAFASYHNLSVKIGKYYPKIVNDIDMGVCHQCITFVPNIKIKTSALDAFYNHSHQKINSLT